jgi:hypothetical protein
MQPFGHFLVSHKAMEKALPNILAAYPGHVSFGSQGPDMFYTLLGGMFGYEHYADTIHRENSLACYCSMLDGIAQLVPESREHQAARAYAHGFFSHVVADVIFHPYVNRLANNNWAVKTDEGTEGHKLIETGIDNCLLGKASVEKEDFLRNLSCHHPNNPFLLDPAIANVLQTSVGHAYANNFDFMAVISNSPLEDGSNNLQRAYRAYVEYNGLTRMFTHAGLNLNMVLSFRGVAAREARPGEWDIEEHVAMNSGREPWCPAPGNEVLTFTGEDLFQMAVAVTAEVINIAEGFLQLGQPDAFSYLSGSGHPLLIEDYNLDTGLPSSLNNVEENRAEDPAVRFSYEVERLLTNYTRFYSGAGGF